MTIKTLTICGDTLEITWDGNVWIAPCNGTQHGTAIGAMRTEIEAYLSASGVDMSDPKTKEEIDMYIWEWTEGPIKTK